MDRMHMAFLSDRDNFKMGKPGLQKIMMAKEVYEALRKINIQEKFLDMGGARVLSEWLDLLPDNTYPN